MGKNNKSITVKTAVIAAAGHGTRLLPLTLHQPKAMVSVADRPLIHYIVDQLAAGGIRRFVIVINPAFQAIRHYVDYQLKNEWREYEFVIVEKISKGFADSVLAAEKFIGSGYFIAVACDDIIDAKIPPFLSLMTIFKRYRQPVAVLRDVPRKEISRYGAISGVQLEKDIWQINDIIEKPLPAVAPSTLGSIADYILPSVIFKYIRLVKKYLPEGKEPVVVDALKRYVADGGKLLGWVFRGHHFDGGSKLGLLKASVHFGSKHPEFGPALKKHLKLL